MARLLTTGFESQSAFVEGISLGGAFSTANPRSGLVHIRATGLSGGSFSISGALGTTYYGRAAIYLSALPASLATLLQFNFSGGAVTLSVLSDGSLRVSSAATLFTSAAGVVSAGAYSVVELAIRTAAGASDYVEMRLNQSSLYSDSALSITDNTVTSFAFGSSDGTVTVDTDDVAVNDSSGANQNSWPGNGRVVILHPVSDGGAIGADSWLAGAGGTTNLWDAVNNTPPVGVIETSATNTSQIKCDTPSTNRTYSPVTQTYTAAGVGASDTVRVTQALVVHGEGVTTGTKAGTVGASANPADGSTTSFNFGNDAGQATTFPTLWALARGPLIYNSSVTKGTGATLALTQNTNTRNGDACYLALLVEFEPAGGAPPDPLPRRPFTRLQAVNRAGSY